ncbi:MAG: T9SS type A sorting domain-containing protein, partial [Salibacteraceae bacterium]
NQFGLQSNWLIDEYSQKDTVFNFQVWSTNMQLTNDLVGEIVRSLNASKPVKSIQTFELPDVYVTKGERVGNELVLEVLNTTKDPFLTLTMVSRTNEQEQFDTTYTTVLTKEFETEEIRFNVQDFYEFDIYFYLNDKLIDKIYMADANWGLDYDRTFTTIDDYEISNDANRIIDAENEYPIFRNVHLESNTADYVSLFKDITAGTLPTDLSEFKGLRFYAKGEGELLIRLSSSNITNWRSQYVTHINLNPSGSIHQIGFENFTSDSSSANINTKQLSNISFTYESKSFDYEDIAYDLSEVGFVKSFDIQAPASVDGLASTHESLNIYPNPNNGRFNLIFNSKTTGEVSLTVSDVQGREINKTQISNTVEGQNKIEVSLSDELEVGNYMVTLEFSNGQKQFAKMVKW